MKKSVLLLSVLFSSVFSIVAGDPVLESCCPVVYENAQVNLSYDVDVFNKHFSPAYYNEKTDAIHFEANLKIKSVVIFNNTGEIEYQLPVLSNKLRLSKKMFNKGEYRVTFQSKAQKI